MVNSFVNTTLHQQDHQNTPHNHKFSHLMHPKKSLPHMMSPIPTEGCITVRKWLLTYPSKWGHAIFHRIIVWFYSLTMLGMRMKLDLLGTRNPNQAPTDLQISMSLARKTEYFFMIHLMYCLEYLLNQWLIFQCWRWPLVINPCFLAGENLPFFRLEVLAVCSLTVCHLRQLPDEEAESSRPLRRSAFRRPSRMFLHRLYASWTADFSIDIRWDIYV